MAVRDDTGFDEALAAVRDVDGWMTDDQARRLWDRAHALVPPATVVEIGSYRGRSAIVLAKASANGVSVTAIDPHAGNDRGPQQIEGSAADGQNDHEIFLKNLANAQVRDRIRHVRAFSSEALDAVDGEITLLYIDGAHRYRPARADLVQWGARVADGGTMLVHDAYCSIGVTLALMTTTFFGRKYRYVGRSQTMTEYRRERVRGWAWGRNAGRQIAQLPWFVRNVVVKIALVTHLTPIARLLGHRTNDWPY